MEREVGHNGPALSKTAFSSRVSLIRTQPPSMEKQKAPRMPFVVTVQTPSVGVTNFVLCPGQKSPDQLIDETESGLLVQTLASGGGMNPISGQFSAGAEGLLIENGKIVRSVRGVAIAGTLLELLKSIDGVADDLSLNGTVGSPMIRVGNLAVSGI